MKNIFNSIKIVALPIKNTFVIFFDRNHQEEIKFNCTKIKMYFRKI